MGVNRAYRAKPSEKVKGAGGKIPETLDQLLNCLSRRSPYCAAGGFIVGRGAAVMYSVFAIVRHS